jgi:hypothetical protein
MLGAARQARDGCRYALANNASSTVSTDVRTIVTTYLSTETSSFTGLTVTVSGTHQGNAVADSAAGPMSCDSATHRATVHGRCPRRCDGRES